MSCFKFSLGDLINKNTGMESTKFTVKAYALVDVDNTPTYFFSTNVKELSVIDMINNYYNDDKTKEIVKEMYNYFNN